MQIRVNNINKLILTINVLLIMDFYLGTTRVIPSIESLILHLK